eukprot:GHVP01032214.1.p1 GENE.GHVP01032214.1~~GHVP01032214.1.p1  ORF type:complete len:296 (-),score=53.32 GHVP01032214.1:273-1160(-)
MTLNRLFRTRKLEENKDPYTENTWDNVEWTEEMKNDAQLKIEEQKANPKKHDDIQAKIDNSGESWNKFYKNHGASFFKNRSWLDTEIPELFAQSNDLAVFEVGCGVGNTLFPLKSIFDCYMDDKKSIFVHGCDISEKAISVIKESPEYNKDCMNVFVYDISNESLDILFSNIKPLSIDCILLIFVLSAIDPSLIQGVIMRLEKVLKKGGMVFFRDYAVGDMAQLRFKEINYLKDSFYLRGDGTCAGFFTEEQVTEAFTRNGFEVSASLLDNRMLVNRKRRITMHRRWLQMKFIKL